MITDITFNIGLIMFFCTALMGIGAYRLITKQNSEANAENGKQILRLGEKIDDFSLETKMEQVKVSENLKTINEKVNRIESDTTAMRSHSRISSESIAKIEIRVENLEREIRKNETQSKI